MSSGLIAVLFAVAFGVLVAGIVWIVWALFVVLDGRYRARRRLENVADPRAGAVAFADRISAFRDGLSAGEKASGQDVASSQGAKGQTVVGSLVVTSGVETRYVVEPDGSGVKLREVSRQFYGRAEHEGQEGDLARGDQLVRDHLPSVHVFGERGDGACEVDGLDRDAVRCAGSDDLRARETETDVSVFRHSSSSVGDGRGRGPRMVGTSEPTEEERLWAGPGRAERETE